MSTDDSSSTTPAGTVPTLDVAPPVREILQAELACLIEVAPSSTPLRREHERLRAALAAGGEIPESLLPTLQHALELLLESGRIRQAHGPAEERQLFQLYQQTPRGQRETEQLRAVNRALTGIAGHGIEKLSFAQTSPGSYRLQLDTDHGAISLAIDRQGISVHHVEFAI